MLLVCKDVLYGLNENSYIKREGSKVTLTIPNECGKDGVFLFDDFPVESLEMKNVLLKNVSIKASNGKNYVYSTKTKPRIIYALLRVANCIPDDVFIKREHSRHFKLIKKISYTTCEPDYGDYTASVYFVKITLKPEEFVHIFFANKNTYSLTKHIALYRDFDGEIEFKDNLKTFVPNNSEEIMSLSELDSTSAK